MKKNQLPRLLERPLSTITYESAISLGLSPFQASIYARRLKDLNPSQLAPIAFPQLKNIQPLEDLKGLDKAANLVVEAIMNGKTLVLASDYDADGLTSAALGYQALVNIMGVDAQRVINIVSKRSEGYGITPDTLKRILALPRVDLVISADQGSSDEAQIAQLKAHGIQVVVTDHHQIPAEGPPPSADAFVNPQQQGCAYDKSVSGVYVLFLLMAGVRQKLIEVGYLDETTPNLRSLLDKVAIGTLADCMNLSSPNNRAIVLGGLQEINQSQSPVWQVFRAKFARYKAVDAQSLAFDISTRINAASRVNQAETAFHWLTANDSQTAEHYLAQLESDNQLRKTRQNAMLDTAWQLAQQLLLTYEHSLIIRLDEGEPGIQGIVANRLAETLGRPVIVCSTSATNILSGSARAGHPAVNLQQIFSFIHQNNGLLINYGGHKAAAGCAFASENLDALRQVFDDQVALILGEAPAPGLLTDGELPAHALCLTTVHEINACEPYGQSFDLPQFHGKFTIQDVNWVGQDQNHLQLKLHWHDQVLEGIYFFANNDPLTQNLTPGQALRVIYQLKVHPFRPQKSIQLNISGLLPVDSQPQIAEG